MQTLRIEMFCVTEVKAVGKSKQSDAEGKITLKMSFCFGVLNKTELSIYNC